MKISIIVPVYNIENHLKKSIDSIISQTYSNWEIILVNDGSSDSSGKICDEFAASNNKIRVLHKENGGVVAARNDGAKIATGKFILFVDGDDTIPPLTLEKFINKQQERNADIVKGSFAITDEEGNVIENQLLITPANINSVDEWINYIIDKNIWSICNNLIKRDLYLKTTTIQNHLAFGEDLLNSIQLSSQIEVVDTIQDITYQYIQRSNSVMNTSNRDKEVLYKSTLKMLSGVDEYLYKNKKNHPYPKSIIRIEDFVAFTLFRHLLSNDELSRKYKQEFYPLFQRYYKNNRRIRIETLKKSLRRYFRYWSKSKLLK